MLRTLLAVAPLLLLQGCWFVFIPGSAMGAMSDSVTGAKGAHCVTASAQVGDTVMGAGTSHKWRVVSLSGTSTRCTDPALPIRAELTPL